MLKQVKTWLSDAQKPDVNIVNNKPLRCYALNFDALFLRDDVMYRRFFNDRGQVQYNQVLLPSSLVKPFLTKIHESVSGHAKDANKNIVLVQRYAF